MGSQMKEHLTSANWNWRPKRQKLGAKLEEIWTESSTCKAIPLVVAAINKWGRMSGVAECKLYKP